MVEEQKLKKLCDYALGLSLADQTEVIAGSSESNTTRFAENKIHQNVSKETIAITVRSIFQSKNGAKIGIASGNASDKKSIEAVVRNSNEIAKIQNPDIHFKSLPEKKNLKKVKSFDQKTKEILLLKKAEDVKKIIEIAKAEKMKASGAFVTAAGELAVANSLGLWAHYPYTEAVISIVVISRSSSGYAKKISYKLEDLDLCEIGAEAIEKAKKSMNPVEIEPGEYDVVLEPYAVAEMIGYLGYLGFGGKQFEEGESFAADNLGKKVFGGNITIYDDPYHPVAIPMPFDWEGYPKESITLVETGVLKNVVYDTYTANKYGKKPTGHSVASRSLGPLTLHLVLAPGDSTKEEMIKSTKKGIFVTRFHYGNAQHFKKLLLTGMTKDGTFLIENGKIIKPIKNMRFTQSIIEALNNVEMIGKDLKLEDEIVGEIVPALKIKNFNFTSKTEH